MKPLKLIMRGINSYRSEQNIDFEELTSFGLFGIFGPTGSGKSSILDAITLALYAKLPRSTKNFININEKNASVSFTFSISTAQTRRYLVERSFRYHGKDTLTVRNISGRLLDITEAEPSILADRPTETTQECIRLLGLNSDDFMRTVVLPQGQFSEFLKLKNAERRSMLQRIFHLEKYGLELTQKIAAARQKQELLLGRLEGQLQNYEDVTKEKTEELSDKLEKSLLQRELTLQEREIAKSAYQKADEIRSLDEEYSSLLRAFEILQKEKPAIEKKKITLETGQKANQLKPFALQAKEAAADYEKALTALRQKRDELLMIQSKYESLQKERAQAACDYEKQLPLLFNQEQKTRTALEISKTAGQWTEKKEALSKALQTQKTTLSDLLNQKEFLLSKNTALREEITALETQNDSLEINEEKRELFEEGHRKEEIYREKRKLYEEHKKSLTMNKQTLEERLSALSEEKKAADRQIESCQRDHLSGILRENLKENCPCPVCGSLHHETTFHVPESSLIKERLQNARDIKSRLEKEELLLQKESARQEHLAEEFALLQHSGQEILTLRKNSGVQNFTEALHQQRQTRQQQNKLQADLREKRKLLESLREKQEALQTDILRLSSQISSAENEIRNYENFIREQWSRFPADVARKADYSSLLDEISARRQLLEHKKKQTETDFQSVSLLYQRLREELSAAENEEKKSASHTRDVSSVFLAQLQKAGFSSDENLESLYLSEKDIQSAGLDISRFETSFQKTGERLQYLKEKRQDTPITKEEWQKRKTCYEALESQYESLQREIALLEHQKETFTLRLKEKEKLEKDQREKQHRKDIIHQLELLFKGNTFIEYMAQSRLRYIAMEASAILSDISCGSYALEIGEDSEFLIRDNKNGGVLRPCDTLSGGETFITSLSLALALSSAIQLNGTAPLELFFLDEGFGSLDEELLDVVMTSLERLQSKNRSIGVITHVEAIQARVPVKLYVTPADAGQEGSRIRLEYT